jgi:16S rRNA (uracil1498-N3)-methyltransferase
VPERRLVIPREWIDVDLARIGPPHRHYLCRVLRLGPGDAVTLLDGSGARYEAIIDSADSEAVHARIVGRREPTAQKLPRLGLVYGLSRRSRTELVLQKATELGVDWIMPALCERSVARATRVERKLERWEEIVRQATRQCGRDVVPLVAAPLELDAALREGAGAPIRLVAHPTGTPLQELHSALGAGPDAVSVAIGPEGGFSDLELARAGSLGYAPVSLGQAVLRTETAAIAFLAVLSYLAGRL